jgi:hypothetical protein
MVGLYTLVTRRMWGTNMILTWNTYLTPAPLRISDILLPHPAMGLKSLGESAAVAERG